MVHVIINCAAVFMMVTRTLLLLLLLLAVLLPHPGRCFHLLPCNPRRQGAADGRLQGYYPAAAAAAKGLSETDPPSFRPHRHSADDRSPREADAEGAASPPPPLLVSASPPSLLALRAPSPSSSATSPPSSSSPGAAPTTTTTTTTKLPWSSESPISTTRQQLTRSLLLGAGGLAAAALAAPTQQPAAAAAAAAGVGGGSAQQQGLRRRSDTTDPTAFRAGQGEATVAAATGTGALVLPAVGPRTKRIFLARHGQTNLNALKVCQGRRLNPPLNSKGRAQAGLLLPEASLGTIVCSPLRRARETAEIVRKSHANILDVSVSDDLIEVDFGGAEGFPLPLSAAFLAPSYVAWSDGRLDVRAGRSGESGVELRLRAAAAAGALLGKCEEGGQVLGVSHSSMIKFTLATLLDVPLETVRTLGQENCAVNALDFDTVSGVFNAVVVNGRPFRGRSASFAVSVS